MAHFIGNQGTLMHHGIQVEHHCSKGSRTVVLKLFFTAHKCQIEIKQNFL
jgi:hypothetical protein